MSKTLTVKHVAISKQVATTAKFTRHSEYAYFVAFPELKRFVNLKLVPNGKSWIWEACEARRNGRDLDGEVEVFMNRQPQRAFAKIVRSFRADL